MPRVGGWVLWGGRSEPATVSELLPERNLRLTHCCKGMSALDNSVYNVCIYCLDNFKSDGYHLRVLLMRTFEKLSDLLPCGVNTQ